ncbi:hypothetical protein HDEF_2240 [Candidatus Hamiltonella defensa 5AT (Acyrthosiphon pisum)]|uniref:Uncharacterized protein n=1 Tax=Hamiltonella defensa subsp. Acyrthosiphon pisum (strain 5AT) TaxID=572265 RepID=C4K8C6_HAMD5|nr:hypothetical protein HDEF_2240 [Candidatus Hamiltonella defensa 5AT (Acyrthosiphon pisum)]
MAVAGEKSCVKKVCINTVCFPYLKIKKTLFLKNSC